MAERNIRKVRFGIGLKVGLFVAAILIVTMIIVGMFIIRRQEATLRTSLRQNMKTYFSGFRKAMAEFITGKDDFGSMRRSMQGYTTSLTNVPNLKSAMFVSVVPNGRVMAAVKWDVEKSRFIERVNIGDVRPLVVDRKGQVTSRYRNIAYLWHNTIDDREPYFIDTARMQPAKYRALVDKMKQENAALRSSNRMILQQNREKAATNRIQLEAGARKIDGWNERIEKNRRALQELKEKLEVAEAKDKARLQRRRGKLEQENKTLARKQARQIQENERLKQRIEDLLAGQGKMLTEQEKTRELKRIPENVLFEGFLPLYINFFRWQNRWDRTLQRGMELFRHWKTKDFAFKHRQDKPRLRDLDFLAELERLYERLYPAVERNRYSGEASKRKPNQAVIRALRKRKQHALSYYQIYSFLPTIMRWANLYRSGRGQYPEIIRRSLKRYQKYAARMLLEYYQGTARGLDGNRRTLVEAAAAGKLFSRPLSDADQKSIRAAIAYRRLADIFLDLTYTDKGAAWRRKAMQEVQGRIVRPFLRRDDQLFVELRTCRAAFHEYLQHGRFAPWRGAHRSYRLGRWFMDRQVGAGVFNAAYRSIKEEKERQVLAACFKSKTDPATGRKQFYLKQDVSSDRLEKLRSIMDEAGYTILVGDQERGAFFRHTLQILLSPFKFGFLRIVLSPSAINARLETVRNRTIDISISLVVRLIFFSFLLSGMLVRNIRRLADGAAAVGQGHYGTRIEVTASDELGQLADEFNEMIGHIQEKLRMQEELMDAHSIQTFLIPESKDFPQHPGIEFGGCYQAQTEAGGDYYDIFPVGKDHFGLVSADVSGHGVGSGLVMTMIRSVLRLMAQGRDKAREVLCKVNPYIYRDTNPAKFATAWYGIINAKTRTMNYACAGHNPAILYNTSSKELKLLSGEGLPLGMVDADTYNPILELKQHKLKAGDVLLLYTDGITEAMNEEREEYQEERLCAAVRRYAHYGINRFLEALIEDVERFTRGLPQEDDISLLAMKVRE